MTAKELVQEENILIHNKAVLDSLLEFYGGDKYFYDAEGAHYVNDAVRFYDEECKKGVKKIKEFFK